MAGQKLFRPAALAFPALTLALLTGCGQSPPAGSKVTLQSADATSRTSVLLRLSGAADAPALDPANYHLRSDAGEVAVRAVYPLPGGQQVLLATDEQGPVNYVLTLTGAPGEIKLSGSAVPAPTLRSVTPLNHTGVLLRFDPAGGPPVRLHAAAENAGLYRLSDLGVTGAKLSADRSAVLLTTGGQSGLLYQLQAAGLYTENFALVNGLQGKFVGIPDPDTTAPRVLGAEAPDRQSVLVHFSEPLKSVAPENFTVQDARGMAVTVREARFADEFHTDVLLTVDVQQDGQYRVSVQGASDGAGNAVDGAASGASFAGAGVADSTPPKVTSVQSNSNTSLTVAFSEPVRGGGGADGAENPANYSVTGAVVAPQGAASTLQITGAKLSPDGRTATLTTLSQADIQYTLSASNIRDLVGNVIDATSGIQNQRIVFRGTPPGGNGQDSDGDGLSDSVEQAGWTVTVTLPGGRKETREVTSDPQSPDTDGDCAKKAEVNDSCLTDRDERALGLDPRSLDSDGDGLGDNEEYNLVFSDPLMQDTDSDGVGDGAEYSFFKTSPILADTDGDQFGDGDEINTANRNPLVADLPRLKIQIGDFKLNLDEQYTYTDSTSKTVTETSASSSTLEQGTERQFSTSDASTLESTLGWSADLEVSYSFPKDFGVTAKAGLSGSETRSYQSTVSRESAERASETYNKSFEKASQFQSSSEVTRTVTGAEMRLAVTLASDSNTAFSLSNLEITALQQDPYDRSRLTPVATLLPESATTGGDSSPTYNLGPLVPEVGPFIFVNKTVYPKTVEDLLKDPRGLVFRVANYNTRDEAGRNFAFASQESFDRTASITIDDGRGNVTKYRVATNSTFGPDGRPRGITMAYALRDILKLNYTVQKTSYAPAEVVTEMAGRSNDPASHQAWVLHSSRQVDPKTNFDDLILKSGESYALSFEADQDDDGLFAREEALYGSKDVRGPTDPPSLDPRDTDGDGLSDFQEVRSPWVVRVVGETEYKVYSDPRRVDSDNDGLSDKDERERYGTDPRKRDSDSDGLSDKDELFGYSIVRRGDRNPTPGFKTNPLNADSDGDGLDDGFERTLGSDPNVNDAAQFLDTDKDGLSDADEDRGFNIVVNGLTRTVYSDKYKPDTDNDGLPDLLESMLGTNPEYGDTDGDTISDYDEFDPNTYNDYAPRDPRGFAAFTQLCGQRLVAERCTYQPTNSKLYGTNPRAADTDGDGLGDTTELFKSYSITVTRNTKPEVRSVKSDPRQKNSDNDGWDDKYEVLTSGTDPSQGDTDGDGVNDDREIDLKTNPLVEDKRVRFAYLRFDIIGNCEDNSYQSGHAHYSEFTAVPSLNLPGGTVQAFPNVNQYSGRGDNEVVDLPGTSYSAEFVLLPGQSFSPKIDRFVEVDSTLYGAGDDDFPALDSSQNTYSFDVDEGQKSWDAKGDIHSNAAEGDCEVKFEWQATRVK